MNDLFTGFLSSLPLIVTDVKTLFLGLIMLGLIVLGIRFIIITFKTIHGGVDNGNQH